MPKEFYTERDIEDMVRRGVLSLELNENVVLTDLAYEKANRLGMKLVRDTPENPPAAPIRPYLSQPSSRPNTGTSQPAGQSLSAGSPPAARPSFAPPALRAPLSGPAVGQPPQADGTELHQRIRNAV